MSHPALRLEGLSVRFPGATAPVVDHVDLQIEAGEIVGLVGESGSGKSMLGFAPARLTPPDARIEATRIELGGIDITHPSRAALDAVRGKRIAYIFQEPLAALSPVRRLGDQMADVLRRRDELSRAQAFERAEDLLREVELQNPAAALQLYPHQWSGGMRQRALIALAFVGKPALVVADEPTTAIDAMVRGKVLTLMMQKARRSGAAILFISHDLEVVRDVTNRTMVMYRGRIVEAGPSRALIDAPRHPYTKMLVAAAPARNSPGRPLPVDAVARDVGLDIVADAGCAFRGRCSLAVEDCTIPQPMRTVADGRTTRCRLA
jgi:peptide/nickel transport system ATP-binding protein